MTLLLTCVGAIVSTIVWYLKPLARKCKVGILCYLYWGAALMWLVDAVYEYMELRAAYFTPEAADMLNDAFLGASVLVLGLIIWLVILLIQDPLQVIGKQKGEANESD